MVASVRPSLSVSNASWHAGSHWGGLFRFVSAWGGGETPQKLPLVRTEAEECSHICKTAGDRSFPHGLYYAGVRGQTLRAYSVS